MNAKAERQQSLTVAGRVISILGAAMMLSWPVVAWWNPALLTPLLPPGLTLTDGTRWSVLVVSLLPAAVFLGAMTESLRLFGLLGRGQAFTDAMPRSLERLGYWALGCVAAGLVTPTLVGLAATATLAEKQLVIRFGTGEIAGLVVALLLLAFGQVMREALRLARENQEFV